MHSQMKEEATQGTNCKYMMHAHFQFCSNSKCKQKMVNKGR